MGSSPCSMASLPSVCRAALGKQIAGAKRGATSASGGPRPCPRRLAFLQAEPRAAVGTRGTAALLGKPQRGDTRSQDRGGRKLCLGAGTGPTQSRGQTLTGLRLRGMALGTKRVLWNEHPASPETPGQVPSEQSRALRRVFVCTPTRVMGGRRAVQPANKPILVTICHGEPEHLSQTAADGSA